MLTASLSNYNQRPNLWRKREKDGSQYVDSEAVITK